MAGGMDLPSDIFSQLGGLGQPQPNEPPELQQHREYAQQLQDAQGQAQSRSQDLMLADRLMKLSDPSIPKPVRQFLYRELSSSLGIDPKGQTSKDVGTMLTALDSQTLEGLRRSIAAQATQAQPGQITQMVRGILQGDVSGMQMLTQARQPLPGRMNLGMGDTSETERPGEPYQPPAAAPAAEVAAQPKTTAPVLQEVVPELVAELGLPPGRYRHSDLIQQFPNLPSGEVEQRKAVADIKKSRDAMTDIMTISSRLSNLVDNNPQALRYSLQFGKERFALPNVASAWTNIVDTWQGLKNLYGVEPSPEMSATHPNPRMQFMTKQAANSLSNKMDDLKEPGVLEKLIRAIPDDPITGKNVAQGLGFNSVEDARVAASEGLTFTQRAKAAALQSAEIESLVPRLAYAVAASKGQSGRALSDVDYENALREIGTSASPDLFKKVLSTTVENALSNYNAKLASLTGGGDIPFKPGTLTAGDRKSIADSPIVPQALKDAVEAPQKPVGPSGALAAAAATTPAVSRGGGGTPSIEQEEATARQRQAEDRAAVQMDRELKIRADRRAEEGQARADRLERMKLIHQAFAQLGQGLAASGGARIAGSAGGGVEGGAQDASAFRLTPLAPGRPPQPLDLRKSRVQSGG